jgi:hypothetical protein
VVNKTAECLHRLYLGHIVVSLHLLEELLG